MKNIKKVEMYVSVNINGTSYEVVDGTNLDKIMNDFRYYTHKNFLEMHDTKLGLSLTKDFRRKEFDGRGMFDHGMNMTLTYVLTFKDESTLLLDFDVDDYASGHPEYENYEHGTMADEFVESSKSGELQWDTDDLEKLIQERKDDRNN